MTSAAAVGVVRLELDLILGGWLQVEDAAGKLGGDLDPHGLRPHSQEGEGVAPDRVAHGAAAHIDTRIAVVVASDEELDAQVVQGGSIDPELEDLETVAGAGRYGDQQEEEEGADAGVHPSVRRGSEESAPVHKLPLGFGWLCQCPEGGTYDNQWRIHSALGKNEFVCTLKRICGLAFKPRRYREGVIADRGQGRQPDSDNPTLRDEKGGLRKRGPGESD